MAYILNSVTIRNPNDMTEDPVETATVLTTQKGKMVKDIRNRKKRWRLIYINLTDAEKTAIKNVYDLESTVTFEVTETNKTVAETNVHVEVGSSRYLQGSSYIESFDLILTEEI